MARPAQMKAPIVDLSEGGTHLDNRTCMEGRVTP